MFYCLIVLFFAVKFMYFTTVLYCRPTAYSRRFIVERQTDRHTNIGQYLIPC